jgi:hypothetical protein
MPAAAERIEKMQKRVVIYLLILIVFFLNAGCTAWSPSDDEAIRLVKDYYLFFYSGKEVEVKVIRREKYIKENECYPIEFLIVPQAQAGFRKTFYFFKNEQGSVAIREFQFSQTTSS